MSTCPLRGSGRFALLVIVAQCIDDRVEFAVHHQVQLMESQTDPMVLDTVRPSV